MLSKSLIQFSVERQDCVPSLLFDLRPNYGGDNEDNGDYWSTGEGNGKPLEYYCLENPMNSMKRQKDRTLPRSVGVQYATGDQWRNNSRKNEGMSQSKNNTQV